MDLIDSLEALRIPDSDFFCQPPEIQHCYERANDMLDDCLEIIWKWLYEEGYVH